MASFALDIRSLSVVLTGVSAIASVVMILIWKTRKTYAGFEFWTAGNTAYAFGFLLIALRGAIPDLFSIILANILILSAAALYLEGIRRFREKAGRGLFSASLIILLTILQSYYTYLDDDAGMRIIILSILVAAVFLMGSVELLHDTPRDLRLSYRFIGCMFALYGLIMAVRALFTAVSPGPHDLYEPNFMHTVTFLVPLLLGICWTFGFVMLNSERLEGDLKSAHVELERLATTDFLTGIANNRFFSATGEREIQRARRYGHPLVVLLFDIDHFKQVNDTYGHAAGDQVLVAIAAACRNFLRDIDVFGRLGGEEFAILLPETDLAGGRATAERLRTAIAESGIETDTVPVHVTISVGVAALSPEDDRIEQVLKRADDAMYEAKRSGRNRTMIAAS